MWWRILPKNNCTHDIVKRTIREIDETVCDCCNKILETDEKHSSSLIFDNNKKEINNENQ